MFTSFNCTVIACLCCALACCWYSQHRTTAKRREKRQNMLNAEKSELEQELNIDAENKSKQHGDATKRRTNDYDDVEVSYGVTTGDNNTINNKNATSPVESCNLCIIKAQQSLVTHHDVFFRSLNKIPKHIKQIKQHENDEILLLRSASLIDKTYGKQLLQLIKPLQSDKFNYRDPRFIISARQPKPKLQTIISQIQHYRQYKQIFKPKPMDMNQMMQQNPQMMQQVQQMMHNPQVAALLNKPDVREKFMQQMAQNPMLAQQYKQIFKPKTKPKTKHRRRGRGGRGPRWNGRRLLHGLMKPSEIPIGSTPTIFSVSKQKFITEINGLLRKDNTKLYTVIADIFNQFIPMFEWCLGIQFSKYEQLSVIIKIQDYQFDNLNHLTGKWHAEGDENDHIVGVGVYYFDITSHKNLTFVENCLQIAEQKVSSLAKENIAKININHNDCIVFKNSTKMQHRAVISTHVNDSENIFSDDVDKTAMISRKMLTFFVMDPVNHVTRNVHDLQFVNFPWKVGVFVKHFTNGNVDLYNQIPSELICLIKIFAFGNETYLQQEMVEFELNVEDKELYSDSVDNPFYRKPRPRFRGCMN